MDHARPRGNPGGVLTADLARFAADDPAPLIHASFACPYCLREPDEITLNLDEPFGSAALCRCRDCRHGWAVTLNFGQALRLALAPPEDLVLTPA
jgi:hypothetical protein